MLYSVILYIMPKTVIVFTIGFIVIGFGSISYFLDRVTAVLENTNCQRILPP